MKKSILTTIATLSLISAPMVTMAATTSNSQTGQNNSTVSTSSPSLLQQAMSPMATGSASFPLSLNAGGSAPLDYQGPGSDNTFYTNGQVSIGVLQANGSYEIEFTKWSAQSGGTNLGNFTWTKPSGTYGATNDPGTLNLGAGWYSATIKNPNNFVWTCSNGALYWN